VETRFFPNWTDDPKIRCYKTMLFLPEGKRARIVEETGVICEETPASRKCSEEVLNIWPGFKADRIHAELRAPDLEELVRPIRHHIVQVIANQNEEHGEWILDWMASIVQRPHIRTEVPIVISGKQGVGKGIIFDFFRENVLGSGISAQIQNPAQDLFSRFANKQVNRLFMQIDEAEGMAKFADQLKNLVTAKNLNYEIKGLMPLVCENYLNIVITTNHERPVLVESSDRRYAMFKASDCYLKHDHYYVDLGEHLKRPEVAKAFFVYLASRDISRHGDGNFQKSRPITEYYLQARNASIPIIQRFLSALINTNRYASNADRMSDDSVPCPRERSEPVECSCTLLFQDFTKFQEYGKFQSNMTHSIFALKIKNVFGIAKKLKRGMYVYEICYKDLFNSLSKNNEFDEEAIL
jgi:hypothetical protein